MWIGQKLLCYNTDWWQSSPWLIMDLATCGGYDHNIIYIHVCVCTCVCTCTCTLTTPWLHVNSNIASYTQCACNYCQRSSTEMSNSFMRFKLSMLWQLWWSTFGLINFVITCVYMYICFRLGDQIVSVNGINLMTVQHADAVQALKDSGKNVVLV